MKNVTLYVYVVIFFIFFVSCKTKNQDTAEEGNRQDINNYSGNISYKNKSTIINVDFKAASTVNYSEIFSRIDYKILNSPKSDLVGKVDKLVEANGMFFIKSNGKIYIFNKDGDFYAKIDQKGDGPRQYRAITDFLVDTLTHRVEILDNHSFSTYEFDFNGKLISLWKHGLLSFKFYKLNATEYLFYVDKYLASTYNGMFLLYNRSKNKVIDYYLPIDKRRIKYENYLDVNNFSANKNELLIACSGNDTIFLYKNKKIYSKYIFSFGKDAVPDEFYNKQMESVVEFDKSFIKNEFAGLYFVSFVDNEKILISQVVKGLTVYYVWYDKTKKKYLLIKKFTDDLIFKGQRILANNFYPARFNEKKAYRVIEPDEIINTLDSLQNNLPEHEWRTLLKQNSKIKELQTKISIESNPVVQILTYK